jgi:hypothetical protein
MLHNPTMLGRRLRLSAENALFEDALEKDFVDAQSRDFQTRGAIGIDDQGVVIKFGRPRRSVENPSDPTLRSMRMFSESDEQFIEMTYDVEMGDWKIDGMSKVYPNRDIVYVNANAKRMEAAQKAISDRWTSKSSVLLSIMFGQTKMNPGVGRVGEFLGDFTTTVLPKPLVILGYAAARRNRMKNGFIPYRRYQMDLNRDHL